LCCLCRRFWTAGAAKSSGRKGAGGAHGDEQEGADEAGGADEDGTESQQVMESPAEAGEKSRLQACGHVLSASGKTPNRGNSHPPQHSTGTSNGHSHSPLRKGRSSRQGSPLGSTEHLLGSTKCHVSSTGRCESPTLLLSPSTCWIHSHPASWPAFTAQQGLV
ncbi:hypothetical protein CLOM_g17952, partial [Closterium sp. NIES-68]